MKYLMNRSTNNPMNEFESMFNDMLSDWGIGSSRVPAVDIQENDKNYVVEAELPGFTEKDVDVNVEKHVLRISSKKEDKKDEKDGKKYLVRERSYSAFERAFSLPEDVDEDHISGSYKNGVLTITLPKKATAQPKKIQIQIGSAN